MDSKLHGLLAQALEEKVGDLSGYEAASVIAESLNADGYVIVPKEPTPEMIAATLPLTGRHHDPLAERTAEQALFILDRRPKKKFMLEMHRKGRDCALDLIGDWRSMVTAARDT